MLDGKRGPKVEVRVDLAILFIGASEGSNKYYELLILRSRLSPQHQQYGCG